MSKNSGKTLANRKAQALEEAQNKFRDVGQETKKIRITQQGIRGKLLQEKKNKTTLELQGNIAV